MKLRSIQSKVLLLFLLLTVVLLLVMSVMVRYGFNQQFNAYKLNQAEKLNQNVVQTLEAYYQQNGSWAQLDDNERIWAQLLVESVADIDFKDLPRGKQKKHKKTLRDDSGMRRIMPQFSLLDAQKTPVVGRINQTAKEHHKSELKFNGETVGFLLAMKPKTASIRDDAKLNKGIKMFLWTLGLVMMLITLLATWPIARYFSQPIKAINTATKKAAAGDFTVRTQVKRSDELGQLSKNFNVLTSTLQSNAEVQKKMMADISHELRTPVAVLQAQVEAIQDGIHQADEKNLGLLHQQISSLGHLINDLHQLSVADLGSLQYQMTGTEIKPIIESALDAVKLLAAEKDLSIDIDIQQIKTTAKVLGDGARLQQMLNNLLINAVAYTDTGGRIKVCVYDNQPTDEYVIEIQDSEPGLLPHELAQMFDRLYRKETSRNKQTGGSGLGLAIVKNIVAAHNGSIEATHAELGGVFMTVRLPKYV